MDKDELGELPSDAAMKKKETVLHDSMVTVRLSEPEPQLGRSAAYSGTAAAATAEIGGELEVGDESGDKDEDEDEEDEEEDEDKKEEQEAKTTPTEQGVGQTIPEEDEESDDTDADTVYETEIARMEVPGIKDKEARRGSNKSDSETESVNWEVLERTEEQEPRDQDTEDVSTPLLPHCL